MPEQDVTTSENKQEEQKEDFEAKWDKERQKVDQAEANYTKAVAENEAITEQLSSQQEKIVELEKKITAKKEDTPYPEIDPEINDANVIKSITQMRAELAESKKELTDLKEYAEVHKASEEQKRVQNYEDMLVEKMCKPLDEEFGVKFRNPATTLARKLVDDGKEKKPQDPIDVSLLMRKCYIEVSKEPDNKDDPVRGDQGGGGVPPPPGEKKSGTNEEVFADMRKDTSWKENDIIEVV